MHHVLPGDEASLTYQKIYKENMAQIFTYLYSIRSE